MQPTNPPASAVAIARSSTSGSPKTPPRAARPAIPVTPSSPISTPVLSRTWSIGTIPICFDDSSPKLGGASPTFPTSSSITDSPQVNYSPQTFGYRDEDRTACHADGSPSSALRKRWKDRMAGGEGSPNQNLRRGPPAFPLVGVTLTQSSPRRRSHISPAPDFLQDRLRIPSTHAINYDDAASENDDNVSVFSLSAYMRPDSACGDVEEETRSKVLLPALEPRAPLGAASARLSLDSVSVYSTASSRVTGVEATSRPMAGGMSSSATDSTKFSQTSLVSNQKATFFDPPPETPITFSYPIKDESLSPSSTMMSDPGSSQALSASATIAVMGEMDRGSAYPNRHRSFSSSGGSQSAGSRSACASTLSQRLQSLPSKISFLKDTLIELHIDQEGFRAIRPRMIFHRHSFHSMVSHFPDQGTQIRAPSAAGEELDFGGLGVAEFKMKSRELFVFHHAALDSSPTLRRVTVNHDDSKDYISRQASLSLKGNGVYTVHGFEDKGRVVWKFEYLVDDRRSALGQPLPGEKTFTPLSFKCSPLLLDPEKGRKIRLLHVVRKSVTPKLSSSKLKPPHLPISPTEAMFAATDSPDAPSGNAELSSIPSKSRTMGAINKVLSRPTTPKKIPNSSRPSTARDTSDRVSPFESVLRDGSSTQTLRQRAASLSQSLRPMTSALTRMERLKLEPIGSTMGQLPANIPRDNTYTLPISPPLRPMRPPSTPYKPAAHLSSLVSGPQVAGRIVSPAQIQDWMAKIHNDRTAPLAPPRLRRPVLPKRPSTAATDGRPWAMI